MLVGTECMGSNLVNSNFLIERKCILMNVVYFFLEGMSISQEFLHNQYFEKEAEDDPAIIWTVKIRAHKI